MRNKMNSKIQKIQDKSGLPRAMGTTKIGALALTFILSACQTSGSDGIFSGALPGSDNTQQTAAVEPVPGQNPNANPRLKNTINSLSDYCPAVRIRAGTETYRTYQGNDKSNPDAVRYQASITKVARECAYVGQNLEITVGARGRVITGPAGGAGSVQMPIRVAVQQGDCSRHFELHNQQATISSGSSNTNFQFVDNKIVIPAPTSRNVRIYLGFDETPNAKASATTCNS